jgi:hypothetical protein
MSPGLHGHTDQFRYNMINLYDVLYRPKMPDSIAGWAKFRRIAYCSTSPGNANTHVHRVPQEMRVFLSNHGAAHKTT